MKTLVRLCHEELIHGWPWIAGSMLATISAVLLPTVDVPAALSGAAMAVNRWLPPVMVFLATIMIIRRGIATSTSGFINKLPTLSPVALSAKLIAVFCFLLIPVVLIHALNISTLGIQLSLLEWLLYSTEKLLIHASFVAWALPGSLLTRRPGSVAAVSGVAGIVGLVLFRWLEWPLHMGHGDMQGSGDSQLASLALIVLGTFPLVTLATAFTWVRARSIAISLIPLVSGTILLFAITRLLPYNFVEELSRDVTQNQVFDEKPEFQLKAVYPEVSASQYLKNETVAKVWTLPGRVTGLKRGWTADMRKIRVIAESPDGATMKVEKTIASERTFDLPIALGIVRGKDFKNAADGQQENDYSPHTVFGWKGTHPTQADMDGIASFTLYRKRVLAELPFEEGAQATWNRFLCKVTRLELSGEKAEASFQISIRGAAIASRGDTSSDIRSGEIRIILANPVTREFIRVDQDRPPFSIHQDWVTWRKVCTASSIMGEDGHHPSIHPSSPGDFLKDARLYVIGYDYAGTIDLPYQIKGMRLGQE